MTVRAPHQLGNLLSDSREHLTAVARMYYLDGMGQSEIADIYQISRSTVSRMLGAAREQGIVQITVDAYEPRSTHLENALRDAFGLQRALVVHSVPAQMSSMRREIAYHAAPEVATWISGGKRVGATGGRSLGELIRAVPKTFGNEGNSFFQLMGAIATTPGSDEAGEITRALGRRMNGKVHMLNVPVYVSDATMRAAMGEIDQVKAMWHMFGRLHQAFVGIGTIEDSMIVANGLLSKPMQRELKKLGAVAEICGRFIDAHGREVDHPLKDRALSIELNVLRTVPDVVAITSGAGKAAAIHAVLANGLATSVVLDHKCAESVLEFHLAHTA